MIVGVRVLATTHARQSLRSATDEPEACIDYGRWYTSGIPSPSSSTVSACAIRR